MPPDRESEFVLAPNEYVFISDQTKGGLYVHVGPCKVQVAGTDQPMIYRNDSYERCHTIAEAVQKSPFADERSYVILKNPSFTDDTPHPKIGTVNSVPVLKFGRCLNIQGPTNFALWPGQEAQVVEGHQLRSNQYLVALIQNAEAAQENWAKAIVSKVKVKTVEEDEEGEEEVETPETPEAPAENNAPKLITGQRLIIKGTDVSFYIPPTGVEIIPDERNSYVRDAVTLEHLKYCILLNENGERRFKEGPAVVFPEPTEAFLRRKNEHGMNAFKFDALELNEQMGIHVKRIDDNKGEELFITGKDQKIYVPKPEHSIIKHGNELIHYAVVIPKGEGRYLLSKDTGAITLKKGPCMFLPDPRKEKLIRRGLDSKTVALWFPGNNEALEFNEELVSNAGKDFTEYESLSTTKALTRNRTSSTRSFYSNERESAEELSFGDLGKMTAAPAPMDTLDTKYDGAVNINIWSGYAIQVISKTGDREVHVGPKSVMLEYDEIMEVIYLSRGTPKTDKNKKSTVYLRVLNNRISDLVSAETKDLVNVKVLLSYRVNFEGDPDNWFNVEDYVGFLTDHLRSMIRNAVKQYGIEEFNDKAISIIRDTVLGKSKDDQRSGRHFEENDMKVYDVEVLDVNIGNAEIEALLTENQQEAVESTLEIRKKERDLKTVEKEESLNQKADKFRSDTTQKKLALDLEVIAKREANTVADLANKLKRQETLDKIQEAELKRRSDTDNQVFAVDKLRLTMHTDSFVNKFKAIQPDLIAALKTAGETALAQELCKQLPQSPAGLNGLFGGGGIEQLMKMVKGTAIEKGFKELLAVPLDTEGNGHS